MSAENFNNYYDFRDCFASIEDAIEYAKDPNNFVIYSPLEKLTSCYMYYLKKDLRQIARMHNILLPKVTKEEMLTHLLRHVCTSTCRRTVYIFKSRSGRQGRYIPGQFLSVLNRGEHIVSREESRCADVGFIPHDNAIHRDAMNVDVADEDDAREFDPLQTADEDLKLGIIREWQRTLALENIQVVVCAACGSRERKANTLTIDGKTIDLKLLRNDELPAGLHPNSYDFNVYDRAILNAKGLSDCSSVGNMIMCKPCYAAVSTGTMPKFGLCNWLYYGRDALPEGIQEAFAQSSMFERMLILRARCNSVCCKFKVSDGDNNSSTLAGLRKGIRGNIMVAPLDTVKMHNVLPPRVGLKDTMTAVIVGSSMPSKHTISKLGPVLVRKSRIQALLVFLLNYNPHYRPGPDLAFSQENLDAIHDHADGPDIPNTVLITQIDENSGTEDVNADYTPRNEEELVECSRQDELMMENVGYTDGDQSSTAYNAMKMLALERCLGGKPFVVSGTGNRLVGDFNNPSILTWLFPHLDPWGIGGFHEPRRKIKLSMEEQLKHLLNSDDVCFEKDPEFAFVFYNILRKMEICRNVRFRVPLTEQIKIVEELKTLDPLELRKLSTIMEQDHTFRAVDPEHIRMIKIMKSVTMTTRSLPGSDGYKLNMRRQIRAIINAKGAPTLFITLNPSDVDHPIVRILGGEAISTDDLYKGNMQEFDAWRRKVYAARNPAASAKFFDLMIQTFIKVILRHGSGRRGLYGTSEAYFGAVEAQGKGTLHLHLLLWLRGHPSPQALRDLLESSEEYKQALTGWLESVIMNEFPVVSERREDDPDRSTRRRCNEQGEPHPGTIAGPPVCVQPQESTEHFWVQYKEHLIRLLHEYNWHVHTATCFKYLKKGEEGSDKNCRMRMDGQLHPHTSFNAETGQIQMRRLHPWISSYTDVVTFLMQCNMNVQFIGSGMEAKAFIYYVTDYVTKSSLPVHAALAALLYAAKKFGDRQTGVDEETDGFYSSSLTKFVNAMMGRQEISHQQVMSYLVGGGDHYTSEKFQNLFLVGFMKFISGEEDKATSKTAPGRYDDSGVAGEESIYLTIEKDNISVNNQVWDYCYRPDVEPYRSMCLYEFVAKTTKRKVKAKEALVNSRDAFSSWKHPQRGTHKVVKRSQEVLPIILGPTLPNRNSSEAAKEAWSKQMLILFKPWREFQDLKDPGQTWGAQYELGENAGSFDRHRNIIDNMQLLTECAEARFSNAAQRCPQFGEQAELDDPSRKDDPAGVGHDNAEEAINNVDQLQQWREQYTSDVFKAFEEYNSQSQDAPVVENREVPVRLQKLLGREAVTALKSCLRGQIDVLDKDIDSNAERFVPTSHGDVLRRHGAIMAKKRKRQLNIDDREDEDESGQQSKRRKRDAGLPFVTIDTLPVSYIGQSTEHQQRANEVITEMNLLSNKEQLEAFMTVSDHVGSRSADQLLLLVSGVGGTGKSHVIKSIVKLFESLGRSGSLLIGAPTGSAAVLVGGATLHSLILEHATERGKKDISKLAAIWKGVTYLIIDEVSMLGAKFLHKLSESMKQAKGDDVVKRDKIFGGVNVIFMGDLCQLKPPRQTALYGRPANSVHSKKVIDKDDIKTMNGIVIWKQVNKVVELVKNCRHLGDPEFSDFLTRLRVGKCLTSFGNPTGMDDYRYLQSRLLSNIYQHNPTELEGFRDAPFIVGSKELRDLLNAEAITYRASRDRKEVHVYHSKDYCKRQQAKGGSAEYLWSLHSSYVRDSFGRLPLFEGMKVMITENVAFDSKIVNGSEGIVRKIIYEEDEDGKRYATAAYVYIEGIGFSIPGLEEDVVPIFPSRVSMTNDNLDVVGLEGQTFTRLQLPLIPGYAYTDFKSQGRTLLKAIVDINTARGQGVYVMMSRVKSLSGIAILRWFPPSKIYTRLPEELRAELARLNCRA
ncbi:hypothetical protein CVT26_007391 [Gymnopilus dilepis]|uniref:ATP-dependent DNA helicase n=1 Tax=Gymnopilus dilepis TaxID=231916 RepID=A0A409WTB9_9AGAR|nr:hypothetical protein CVT26_007391 [Gymnopilus dilepis]